MSKICSDCRLVCFGLMLSSRQLEYFRAVARELHFTRAAAALNIAQPALSQHIRKLERQLGLTLFERDRHGVELTPAGAALLDHAERILADIAAVDDELRDWAGGVRGVIRLGAARGVMTRLARVLAGFGAEYPAVDVHLREETTAEMVADLHAGRLDAATLAALPPSDGRLASHPFGVEPLVLVAGPGSAFASRISVSAPRWHRPRHVRRRVRGAGDRRLRAGGRGRDAAAALRDPRVHDRPRPRERRARRRGAAALRGARARDRRCTSSTSIPPFHGLRRWPGPLSGARPRRSRRSSTSRPPPASVRPVTNMSNDMVRTRRRRYRSAGMRPRRKLPRRRGTDSPVRPRPTPPCRPRPHEDVVRVMARRATLRRWC